MDTKVVPIDHNEPNLDRLAERWIQEKTLEEGARKRRIELENEMLPLCGTKHDGQATTTTKHGKKITVNTKMNRKLDGKKLLEIRKDIPAALLPVRVTHALDNKLLKYLANNEPDVFEKFSRCIITKPATANFRIDY